MAVSLEINVTETSYSTPNNYSNVKVDVYVISTGSYNNNNQSGTVKLSGSITASETFTASFSQYSRTQVFSKTYKVTHASDGSGNVTVTASFATGVSAGTITATKKLTLTNLKGASTPTLSGSFVIGEQMKITTNRKSSNYTHTIVWAFKGHVGTVAENVGASYTWTIPEVFETYLSSTESSSQLIIECITYSGSTKIGTTDVYTTVYTSGTPPTFEVLISDAAGYQQQQGSYVAYKSRVKVDVYPSSSQAATISKVTVSMSGTTLTGTGANPSVTFDASVLKSGVNRITVEVTDSRGSKTTRTYSIEAVAYQAGSLYVTAGRYNSSGVEDDTSTTVRVYYRGSANGGGTLKITLDGSTKRTITVGSTFNSYISITGVSTTTTHSGEVQLTDSFGEVSIAAYSVGTESPIMDFAAGGNGMALWAISSIAGLHVNHNVTIGDDGGSTYRSLMYFDSSGTQRELMRFGADTYPRLMQPIKVPTGVNFQFVNGYNDAVFMITQQGSPVFGSETYGLDLNWGTGGPGGKFRKTLWSGSWSSGNKTITDANDYNMFIITCLVDGESTAQRTKVLAIRENKAGTGSRISGIGGVSTGSGSGIWLMGIFLQSTASNTWSFTTGVGITTDLYEITGMVGLSVTKIEGVM